MTQEMQLSVKLLQMSSFELQEYVEREIQENPVIDVKESNANANDTEDDKLDYRGIIKDLDFNNYSHHSYGKNDDEEVSPFNFISEKKSLREYLKDQVRDLNESNYIKAICLYIIENIDNKGYLILEDEEIGRNLRSPKIWRCIV